VNGLAKTSARGKCIFEQGTINKTLVKENPCLSGNQFQEDTRQKNPVATQSDVWAKFDGQ